MGQHRLMASKYTAYEEDIRVPLIVRGPGVPAGRVVDALASTVDLAPTFAQLTGATLKAAADGRSLVPLWRQPRRRPTGGGRSSSSNRAPWADPEGRAPGRRPVAPGPRGSWSRADDDGDLQGRIFDPVPLSACAPGLQIRRYANGDREYYDLVADPYELQTRPGTSPRPALSPPGPPKARGCSMRIARRPVGRRRGLAPERHQGSPVRRRLQGRPVELGEGRRQVDRRGQRVDHRPAGTPGPRTIRGTRISSS